MNPDIIMMLEDAAELAREELDALADDDAAHMGYIYELEQVERCLEYALQHVRNAAAHAREEL